MNNNLRIVYCSTSDGSGEDIVREIESDGLYNFSNHKDGSVILYSSHKQDLNLVQCICDAFGITEIQLISVTLI